MQVRRGCLNPQSRHCKGRATQFWRTRGNIMKLHPSHLWIGPEAELKKRAALLIKDSLCKAYLKSIVKQENLANQDSIIKQALPNASTPNASSKEDNAFQAENLGQKACNSCASCINIDHKRHHLVTWLTPENYYTLAQLEGVAQTLTFALQPGEQYFIVFEQAQLFNIACANSLLKSLEEPPVGYHFILLASRAEGILPTIRSRCLVEHFQTGEEKVQHELLHYFTPINMAQAADFVREFERIKMTERDMYVFVDELMAYWHARLHDAYEKNVAHKINQSQQVLEVLQSAQSLPVMPGSTKLFLKNLYLALSVIGN